MEYITLNNGIKIPILGLGVFQIDDYKKCEEIVLNALQLGYRLIDTASAYGNEEAVGNAIKKSGIPREELFITTKLWVQDTGYENTIQAFHRSLRRLQLDYIDAYLIHQPYGDYYGSYRALAGLYAEGKIKAIGVSNFYQDMLVDLILHTNIVPAINQLETNVFLQRESDLKLHHQYNVQLEACAPFAEGKYNIFNNPILKEIADTYQKSTAQVMLRWFIERGIVTIPKTSSKEKLKENISIFDFHLTKDDIQKISTLNKNESSFFSHYNPKEVERMNNTKFN